jgi:U3 small nucleolar RNA-associated protein 10
MESAVVGAFVEFVTKLNDTAFRPLFRKLFDWAFTGEPRNVMQHRMCFLNRSSSVPESTAERKIAFCNVYMGLLDYFKVMNYTLFSVRRIPFH